MSALPAKAPDVALSAVQECLLLHNSEERPRLLVQFLSNAAPDVFWPLLLAEFSSCDGSWAFMAELRRLARESKRPKCSEYLSGDALVRFSQMPEQVRVYRGCSRERIMGLSWTTDRSVAKSFAHGHRGIRVPDSVIANATISKNDIYGLILDRNEEEVLLESDLLKDLNIVNFKATQLRRSGPNAVGAPSSIVFRSARLLQQGKIAIVSAHPCAEPIKPSQHEAWRFPAPSKGATSLFAAQAH